MANPKFCRQCGGPLTPAARFCAQCGLGLDGAPAVGGAPTGTPTGTPTGVLSATVSLSVIVPWFVLASLLMVVLGYFIGARGAPPAAGTANADRFDGAAPIVAAPDISSLSPEERVDRLFNRVMALAAAGQDDSVSFFAPMAINALAALMPLDAHRRYDLGLIHLAAGDATQARAQADTILAAEPSHLLGLALGMRAAISQGRAADAKRLGARLTALATGERAKGLREYADHAPDISEAIEEAAGKRTSRISQPR